ncbi:MAG TPA: hypothetical protein VLA33_02895 [Gemmatimonadota bacterium]|nr:hypothetical protein [Gemmatimonadota bacterium]
MRESSLGLLFGAVLLGVAASTASAQEIAWAGSLDVTNGDYYFSERTTALWLTNGVVARSGAFWFDASLPVLLQNSDAVTRVGGLSVPTGGSRRGGGVGDGMGSDRQRLLEIEDPGSLELDVADPLMGFGVDLPLGGGALRSVRVGVSAKAPMRSVDSGIGTGQWDFGVGAGTSVSAGSLVILLDGTWWMPGDMPDLELNDVLEYGGMVGGWFGDGSLGWSLVVSGSTSMIDDVAGPVSTGGDLLFWSDTGSSLRAGLRFGLTESAADVAVTLGWAVPLTG